MLCLYFLLGEIGYDGLNCARSLLQAAKCLECLNAGCREVNYLNATLDSGSL